MDVKTVVSKLGKLEKTLKQKIESGTLANEVKRFANSKTKELKQRVKTNKDLKKVVAVVVERRKQVEKIAKDLPREVKTLRTYVESQRKELEKIGNQLLTKVKEAQKNGKLDIKVNLKGLKAAARKAPARKTTTKKAAARKTTKKTAR